MSSWDDLQNYCAPSSTGMTTFTCSNCGQTIRQPSSYVIYESDFNEAKFCTYKCKCEYYKKHENERNLYLEQRYEKLFEPQPKTPKPRKKRVEKPKIEEYTVNSKFDLEKHKKTFIDYLEVCILPDGTVEYAVPSHQEYIINYIIKKDHITREALMNIPYIDTNMLTNISGICQVWSNYLIVPNTPTYEQIEIINKFIEEDLLWTQKKHENKKVLP